MVRMLLPKISLASISQNRSYKLDLNKFDKPYLDVSNFIKICATEYQKLMLFCKDHSFK